MRKLAYDPRAFEWFGSVAVRSFVGAVWHTVEADTIEKMRQIEVIFGSSGTGALNFQVPTLMNMVAGRRVKVVTGYGRGDINLAMECGEVQACGNFYTGFVSTNADWIRDGKLKFFFVMGPPVPELSGVPRLRDKALAEEGRQMFNLMETGVEVGQGFLLPPGTPKARVEVLRRAFDQMLADPQFLAEAAERNLDIIAEAYETPPEIAQRVAAAFGMDKGR